MLITRLGGGDSVEGLEVVDEVAVGLEELDVRTVLLELAGVLQVEVLLAAERGETPALRDDDLLLAGELVTGTAESLHDDGLVGILASDGKDDLANVDTGDHTVGLAPGASHSGLESIGTGAGQHLVDTDDVVRVDADAHVERVLAGGLCDVLVGADTGGLECLGGQLLVLVRDEVAAEGELIDRGTLAAKVEDTDLWVRDTSVEPRLGERLVLAVAVAPVGS